MSPRELLSLYLQLKREFYLSTAESLRGKSMGRKQMMLIRTLHDHGAATPGGIRKNLKIDPAALSRSLSLLVERGLVVESENLKDRRTTLYALTPEGEAIVPQMEESYDVLAEACFSTLSEQEQADFSKIMVKVIEAAKASRKPARKKRGPVRP